MAEFVGGAFLSAAFQVLFDRLASREFISFFRGRKHDNELLNQLKLKLLGLNKVLNDAEDKQITDRAVKDWLDKLKHDVFYAEDIVDEIATEALRCKAEAEYQSGPNKVREIKPRLICKMLSCVSNCLISTSTSLFDSEIESSLKGVIDSLEGFEKQIDVLGLREGVGQNLSRRLPTTSVVDDGRDSDKEKIIKLLLSDGESGRGLDVIPIVGMGGVGKTTLAQLVYNDRRVVDHFPVKAWVCVSDKLDVLEVQRTILGKVTLQACDAKDLDSLQVKLQQDLDSLQVKLQQLLSREKFLIILDDVWTENYDHWESLMTPFRFGAHGSRIIVTTRNDNVAERANTVPIHRLKELSNEDCWKLFANRAFEIGDCNEHPNLEKIGKEIVKKCKGLPLAAKTLGGLLRSKRDDVDWNSVMQSGIWDLPEGKGNILPALRLSYHYLPSRLKRCFAHCSVFPKDYEFQMEELVLEWIADGFVEKPLSNKTLEEEGCECFRELLSRSFFQRSSADDSCFAMHDLFNDLAQSVAGDFGCRLEDDKPRSISEKVRHFSFAQGRFDGFEKLKVIKEAKVLRTFLPVGRRGVHKLWPSKKVLDEILPRLIRLRLLSLARYQIMELPHSIGNMIHLRYLDLSYTQIKQLPESVCTLYNLETLLLSNCHLLSTLPAEIGKLILLRHLDLTGTNLKEMPMQMSILKDLQRLTAFVVGKGSGSGIDELKEFHNLRGTISISSLQNVTNGSDASEAKMWEKEHLEKLVLEWDGTTNDSQNAREVFDKLKPHTNLKHLVIKNYGGTRFPDWLGDPSFSNMVSVHLENCENCFYLPPLGQLPALKELTISRLWKITNVGHEFYGKSGSSSKPFQYLERLRFEEMVGWVEWHTLDAGEFPQLKKLQVIKCPKLTGDLPKNMPSLVRLEIKECPELAASLPRSSSIRELELENCQGIELEWQAVSFVEIVKISKFASLKEFASEMFSLTNLKEFSIVGCPSLLSFPDIGLPPALTSLVIEDCEAMQCFPKGMMRLNNLEKLDVWGCRELVFPFSQETRHFYTTLGHLSLHRCYGLKSLPLGFVPKLRYLHIESCENLETLSIPNGVGLENLTSLEVFNIKWCKNLVSFPSGGLPAPNLSWFKVWGCKKLKALPEQMHTLLPSLQSLVLHDCPEIESFPEGGLPSKLRYLQIWNCEKLVGRRRDWVLQTLPSLQHFTLGGKSEDVVESFPEEGLMPSTLTSLRIRGMLNLKSLSNRGLQHLGSLKYMGIWECDQLQSLPEEGLPTSLFLLEI